MTLSTTRIRELASEIGAWQTSQFRSDGSPPNLKKDVLAIIEELGELSRCVNKISSGIRRDTDWSKELETELADVVVTLLGLAANFGLTIVPNTYPDTPLTLINATLVLSACAGALADAALRTNLGALQEHTQGAFVACEFIAACQGIDLTQIVNARWQTVGARRFVTSNGDT